MKKVTFVNFFYKKSEMELLEKIKQNASFHNKRIVLPEGKEPRTLKAAEIVLKEKIARLILLGDSKEILDIAGTLPDESSLKGKSDPNWILYEDNTGVVRAVRAEWNLYVPRFRIEKSSDTLIADEDKSYTFSARDFLGTNKVVVENRNVIASFESAGAYRQQSYIQTAHILTAFALLLLEGALMLCVEKRTKKRT